MTEETAPVKAQTTTPAVVDEQRPIAPQEPNPTNDVSDLTKRLIEEGEISTEAMGPECYERAASAKQKAKAAKASVSEAIKVADVVRITRGPHRGRVMAVTRVVSYATASDHAIKSTGAPEARFIQPQEVEGRCRGDERDGELLILDVEAAGLVKIPNYLGTGRG